MVEGLNVLMKVVVDAQMFTGYKFGLQDGVYVSHLQFADDTLSVGEKSWVNVHALRAVLVLFESVSGLKVNFHKSMLCGINICDSWLGAAASSLSCKVGRVPFMYLGLPVGGDARRLAFQTLLLHELRKGFPLGKAGSCHLVAA